MATSPFDLAAALLRRNARIAIPIYLLLVALDCIPIIESPASLPVYFGTVAVRRIVELVGLAILFLAAIKICKGHSINLSTDRILPLLGYGISVSVLLAISSGSPMLSILVPAEYRGIATIGGFALSAGLLWLLYLHFMYAPVVLGGTISFNKVVSEARNFTRTDPWLPLKVLLPGFALTTALQSIAQLPAPDGGSISWNIVASLFGPLSWLLQSHLAISFYLTKLPADAPNQLGLSTPVDAACAAIALEDRGVIGPLLAPNRSGWAAFVAILLWLANYVTALTIPPTVQLSATTAQAVGKTITLRFSGLDSERQFRGFQPMNLHLRSADDTPIRHTNSSCTVRQGDATPAPCAPLPRTQEPLTFELTLSYSEPPQGTVRLWYRNAKLMELHVATEGGQGP